uniref:Vitronectin n=1 Tax=Xenopus tropicalis TaxID=8364 RepID=F7CQ66_XENTR
MFHSRTERAEGKEMKVLLFPALLLLLGAVGAAQAAEESCAGRCFSGFDGNKKCQCDILCVHYESCCIDYMSVCKPKETRGDVFEIPEDEYNYDNDTSEPDLLAPMAEGEEETVFTKIPDDPTEPATNSTAEEAIEPEKAEESEDELCSGKPFDAFTNIKNGSNYAFRGKYFYELDDKRALDGYPKLIKDVWGIEGPVDAAFTRINCQGKTYLFKGKEYWRFSDGVLESGYPRSISEGFHNIPDNIDAAFALPANNYNGREKAYFFKGNRYWQYEFQNQPSWRDCQDSAQSDLFSYYVSLQKDSWEDFFSFLFGSSMKSSTEGPWYINKDWKGVPNNVDAVLPSRIYVPKQTRRSRRRKSRRRPSRRKAVGMRSTWSDFSFDPLDGLFDYDDEQSDPDWLPPERPSRCQPTQNVYFFKNDKYYRVNLRTKRVDYVYPPYPRSIAQYWLGCKKNETLEKSRS